MQSPCQIRPHKRSPDFTAFLSGLVSAYAVGTIYVILDNVSIHHSKATLTWLAAHPRVCLVYLPTYSGHQLNPVEKVWWQLKRTISANRNFRTVAQMEAALHTCLSALRPDALLLLTNSEVTRQAQLALATSSRTSGD